MLGEKKNEEIDNLLDSASDYTIRIENLPFGKVNETELINFVVELWDTREEVTLQNIHELFDRNSSDDDNQKLDLRSIQIIYDMSECRKLINKVQ